jgi:hypothetical protein
VGACVGIAALLAGCTLAQNLSLNAQASATPSDGRIMLAGTQRITVQQRDVQNYTCGNLTLLCTSWGKMYNCYCQ